MQWFQRCVRVDIPITRRRNFFVFRSGKKKKKKTSAPQMHGWSRLDLNKLGGRDESLRPLDDHVRIYYPGFRHRRKQDCAFDGVITGRRTEIGAST